MARPPNASSILRNERKNQNSFQPQNPIADGMYLPNHSGVHMGMDIEKKPLTLIGNARVYRHIRVGAAQWKGGVTAPSEKLIGVAPALCFDKTNDDSAHFGILIPYRLAEGTDITINIDWTYEGVQDNGTVCWGVEYINLETGDTIAGTTATIIKTSTGNHPTGTLIRTKFTDKIIGAVAHDGLGMRLYRDASADTLDTDACLLQVHFEFLMDKLGEGL